MQLTISDGKLAYEYMQSVREYTEALRRYLHIGCEVVKHIKKHIATADDCVLVNRRGRPVFVSSASYGVSVVGFSARDFEWVSNHDRPQPPKHFTLEVSVVYVDEDNMQSSERYSIPVPIRLLTDFNEKEWEEWLKVRRDARDALVRDKEIETLKRLLKKYPDAR